MLKLRLETGDYNKNLERISISIVNQKDKILINFNDSEAVIDITDFNAFLDIVLELKFLKVLRMKDAVSSFNVDVIKLFERINSTASYQLFLACCDVAKETKFSLLLKDNFLNSIYPYLTNSGNYLEHHVKLFRYFQNTLSGKKISLDQSLIIFPDYFLFEIPEEIISKLMKFNKIGIIEVIFEDNSIIKLIYKPYSTPNVRQDLLTPVDIKYLEKIYSFLNTF
ncbi:MAG: hypothetical protein WC644_04090 [Ignavibacteria bacterium]